MSKFKDAIKKILPSKRKLIQLYSALLFNANLKGFANGEIYKGPLKNVCAPGLNCYSCPGAAAACPLGSLQNALGNSEKRTPYYVFGILLLYSILLGRFICGFLCPFGLIQELLYKIKTPKLKKNAFTRILSFLKYVVLVVLVVIVPILYGLRNVPLPAFCKYICPAGTLEGALGLLSNKVNEGQLSMLGPLFTWKFILMVSILVGSIFVFRLFCRFLCPLGALYGIFNKISILGIRLEKPKCVDCGLCRATCKMDIRSVGDHECINCGECMEVCPTKAISWKGSKVFLAPNEINLPENAEEGEKAAAEAALAEKKKKVEKRNKVLKITLVSAMVALLAGALVYYNVIDKPSSTQTDTTVGENETPRGNQPGDLCYGEEIALFDENGLTGETFDPAANIGKITVINFWGTWCTGCIKELPYFDRIASEYEQSVTVIAIHTELDFDTAADYVLEHFPDSKMLFGKDSLADPNDPYGDDKYYAMLGGTGSYPITLILDENGVVLESILSDVTYDELKSVIDAALTE